MDNASLSKMRWGILAISCLINLCIGSMYAWSSLSAPMSAELGADLSAVFSTANAVSFITMIIGGTVKVAINWFLVGNPAINIYGAPIGTICCYLIMCSMNIFFMYRCMESRPSVKRMFMRPLVSSLLMGVSAWVIYTPVAKIATGIISSQTLAIALAMFGAIGCACIIYLVLIIATKAVTYEDMKLIPKGEKLAKLLHIH